MLSTLSSSSLTEVKEIQRIIFSSASGYGPGSSFVPRPKTHPVDSLRQNLRLIKQQHITIIPGNNQFDVIHTRLTDIQAGVRNQAGNGSDAIVRWQRLQQVRTIGRSDQTPSAGVVPDEMPVRFSREVKILWGARSPTPPDFALGLIFWCSAFFPTRSRSAHCQTSSSLPEQTGGDSGAENV